MPVPNNVYTAATSSDISDEQLLKKYDRLICYESRKIAKSYDLGPDVEDIAQEARIKLLRLPRDVRDADAYCRTTIYNAIRDARRKLCRQTDGLLSIVEDDDVRKPGENAPGGGHFNLPWTINEADMPPDATRPVIDALHDHDLYTRLTASLTSEQMLVVGIWYGLDGADGVTSPRSISRRTGIKEARVTEILRAALAKLRNTAKTITRSGA